MGLSIAELTAQLQEEKLEQRIEAAQQLARLGTEAAPAAVSLLAASDCEDEALREWATAALENCGAPDADDLSRLVDFIQPNSGVSNHVVYWALTLIGRMENVAHTATTKVCHFVDQTRDEFSTDENNREIRTNLLRGIWALGKIAGDDARAKQLLVTTQETFPQFSAQIQRSIDLLQS